MKLKDLPKIDRPREKLEKYGPERLSNSELLAILLGTGQKGINVIELSKRILSKFNTDGLAKATIRQDQQQLEYQDELLKVQDEAINMGFWSLK